MFKIMRTVLLLSLLVNIGVPAWADNGGWEYRVVILQGIMGGTAFEKQARGIYVDTKRTRLLNELAVDGWEVVSVIGVPAADHTVYLRRTLTK